MWRSYHFLMGPLVAFLAVGVLILLSRWAFGGSTVRPRPGEDSGRTDYGLLVPVATVGRRDDAEIMRLLLADAGIRGTVAPADTAARRSGFHLLVFPAAAARARDLLAGSDR